MLMRFINIRMNSQPNRRTALNRSNALNQGTKVRIQYTTQFCSIKFLAVELQLKTRIKFFKVSPLSINKAEFDSMRSFPMVL